MHNNILGAIKVLVDNQLKNILTQQSYNSTIEQAMWHALDGGKRIRSQLVYASFALHNKSNQDWLNVACAIECFHAYSLVHDDLPAMDNDSLRRGKPTVHKAFGESTAILVGDALLTLGFELLTHEAHKNSLVMIKECAKAIGAKGMVYGQYLDLLALDQNDTIEQTQALWDEIALLKTGALFIFCVKSGLLFYGKKKHALNLDKYGYYFGLLYQMIDDIEDAQDDAQLKRLNILSFTTKDLLCSKIKTMIQDVAILFGDFKLFYDIIINLTQPIFLDLGIK